MNSMIRLIEKLICTVDDGVDKHMNYVKKSLIQNLLYIHTDGDKPPYPDE